MIEYFYFIILMNENIIILLDVNYKSMKFLQLNHMMISVEIENNLARFFNFESFTNPSTLTSSLVYYLL